MWNIYWVLIIYILSFWGLLCIYRSSKAANTSLIFQLYIFESSPVKLFTIAYYCIKVQFMAVTDSNSDNMIYPILVMDTKWNLFSYL